MRNVVIIGAGVGGLTAAIRLARHGVRVTVYEARDRAGGLAAGFDLDGFPFDAGPYILLDRPGLRWAFAQAGIDLDRHVPLQRIGHVYQAQIQGQPPLDVFDSLERTAQALEHRWPGSRPWYERFIARTHASYRRLQPLQCAPHVGLGGLLRCSAWRDLPFLLRPLRSILGRSGLPPAVAEALGVWTHVAGQTFIDAPAPLALVPAVIHHVGAYYPHGGGGIGAIPQALFETAQTVGVDFRFNARVEHVRCRDGLALGVEMAGGEFTAADAVISDIGLGTYLHLLDPEGTAAVPLRMRRRLQSLPLQSPGVCAYLAVKGQIDPPYLRFHIRDEHDGCRLLVTPAVLDPALGRDGWSPARLIAPMNHARAESAGEAGQRAFLERALGEDWWRKNFQDFRVLATRIPMQWGRDYHLFRNSMNPVMTAAFMRAGRLAHRSPWIRRLYLAGSSTHPGQWVSFCSVSGILAADQVLRDLEG
jgi:phytoene dehydrogenase-like protein